MQENQYTVSVTYELHTEESVEQGEAAERGYEVERENYDLGELERLVRDYGFSEPSSSTLTHPMWFSSTTPREDRAHFEKGESRYFSLHLHEVNGEPPTLEDYADIARMARIKMPELATIGTRIPADEDEPDYGFGQDEGSGRTATMAEAQAEYSRNSGGLRLFDDGLSDEDRAYHAANLRARSERARNPPVPDDGSNDIPF